MAVPKRKTGYSRRKKRRNEWEKQASSSPTPIKCQECGVLIPAHSVCPKCNYYKNKKVMD